MQYVNPNSLSSVICDAYDVKNTIASLGLNNQLKDNDGTTFTLEDCMREILLFLEELEATLPNKENLK